MLTKPYAKEASRWHNNDSEQSAVREPIHLGTNVQIIPQDYDYKTLQSMPLWIKEVSGWLRTIGFFFFKADFNVIYKKTLGYVPFLVNESSLVQWQV